MKLLYVQLNNLIVLNTYAVDAQAGGQSLALAQISMVKDEDGGWSSCGDEVSLLWMQESNADLWLQLPA